MTTTLKLEAPETKVGKGGKVPLVGPAVGVTGTTVVEQVVEVDTETIAGVGGKVVDVTGAPEVVLVAEVEKVT